MDIELAKAIFAAGFKAGHESGYDDATSHEWGSISHKPQKALDAWKEDIDWRISTNSSYHLDISKAEDWNII